MLSLNSSIAEEESIFAFEVTCGLYRNFGLYKLANNMHKVAIYVHIVLLLFGKRRKTQF